MPYDANGNYSLPNGSLVATGEDIVPPQHNTPLTDIGSSLSQVLLRSGVAPMSGNLPMGGNRITNLAEPVGDNDAARKIDLPASLNSSKVIHYDTNFVIPTGTPLVVRDIDTDFREFMIEADISGLSNNPGGTSLVLEVGDGTTWGEFSPTEFFIVNWPGNNTTARRVLTKVYNLDDDNFSVVMVTRASNNTGSSSGFLFPDIYTPRPITALRFRLNPPSGSPVCNVSALRVTGIYK